MRVTETILPGVLIIEPDVIGNERGYFLESYSSRSLQMYGVHDVFLQDNHSFSQKAGTLRGLHYQRIPHAQAKIIRCTRGAVLDVAVDIRVGSPTYGRWISVVLSGENFKQFYVPVGFATGYLTLTDDIEIQYKASDFYYPDNDRSIKWDDPAIGIDWGIDDPILSSRDRDAPPLAGSDNNFRWGAGR